MGENQGLPSNQLGIEIVSPTVFTQALEETEAIQMDSFHPLGCSGLPSVSTRGYERIKTGRTDRLSQLLLLAENCLHNPIRGIDYLSFDG